MLESRRKRRLAARRAVEATRVIAVAESLGGVEALIEIPAAMAHASTTDSPIAVDPGMVRLSVGLEHVDDLMAALDQALGGYTTTSEVRWTTEVLLR